MGNQRRFTKEYNEEIIKLVTEQCKRVTHVARDIGVTEATVRGWIRRYKEHDETIFPGSGNLRPEDAEVKALKKNLADIQEANEIFKKAIHIFTKPEK